MSLDLKDQHCSCRTDLFIEVNMEVLVGRAASFSVVALQSQGIKVTAYRSDLSFKRMEPMAENYCIYTKDKN